MTRDEAAEALEALVEARGPDWVANTWGIARDRLAGWLEGSEDLPDWMVTVMQVWTSAQREKAGDAGGFEGSDHPPEVPEDVTETGLDAVPMPTVGRGEALWDAYRRQGSRYVYGGKLREMIKAAWKEAGEKCSIDALREYEWLPEIMPHDAWDKGCSWASVVDALADVVRSAIEGDE